MIIGLGMNCALWQLWSTYNSDTVVEQWFAKDKNIENIVNMYFFEDGQHCDRVDRGDNWRKKKRIK